MAQYKLCRTGILDTLSSANIPIDPANRHYQAYLQWFAAGNTPDAADPAPIQPTVAQQAQDIAIADPAMRGLIRALAARLGITAAQLIQEMKAQA